MRRRSFFAALAGGSAAVVVKKTRSVGPSALTRKLAVTPVPVFTTWCLVTRKFLFEHYNDGWATFHLGPWLQRAGRWVHLPAVDAIWIPEEDLTELGLMKAWWALPQTMPRKIVVHACLRGGSPVLPYELTGNDLGYSS